MSKYISLNYEEMRPRNFYLNAQKNIKKTYININTRNGFKLNKYCPICKSHNVDFFFKNENNELLKCSVCKVGFLKKFARNLNDIYNIKSYIHKAKESYLKNENYRKKRFAEERLNLIKKFIKKKKNCTLFDVGCGTGWFLQSAKKSYEIIGQEFSTKLAELTGKKIGCPIYNDKLPNIKLKKKIDVITCFDVVEHLLNPEELFKFAYKNLKKNGILVVFTPNLNSICFNYLKNKSQLFCADHLYYFNLGSLEYLGKKNNLKNIFYSTNGTDIFDILSYKESLNKINIKNKNFFCNCVQKEIDKNMMANHLRIIFKK